MYISDRNNHRLRRIEAATGLVSTVAGSGTVGRQDGPALAAQFSSPWNICLSSGKIYIADLGNNLIRQVTGLPLATNAVKTSGELKVEIHPNPVATSAILRYFLPQASRVKLVVADILGRLVATLVAGEFQQAGWQQASFESGALPGGVYIASLEANGKASTARILVVH